MAFDPDEFLAASSPKAKAESFDPDEFLASTAPAGSPKPPSPPPDRAAGDDPWQTVARKGSSIASFGFANPIAAAATAAFSHAPGLGPVQSYSDALKGIGESDAASKAANPKADLLGTGLGVVASLPVGGAIGKGIGAVAGGVARVAGVTLPKLGAVASGAASGAGYGALGGVGDAASEGGSAGDLALGGLRGGLVGGTLGAVGGKLFKGAPEEVNDSLVEHLSRGEAGGKAAQRLSSGLLAKGEEDVAQVLKDTDLRLPAYVSSKGNPAKVLGKVEAKAETITSKQLDPVYEAMTQAKTGPTVGELKQGLTATADSIAQKDVEEAARVQSYRDYVDGLFKGKDETVLNGEQIRSLRNNLGKSPEFSLAPGAKLPLGATAKNAIYGTISKTINVAAARTPGLTAEALAAVPIANKQVSILLAARSVLADRAAKAAAGGSSLAHSVAAGGGLLSLSHMIANGIHGGNLVGLAGSVAAHFAAQPALRLGVAATRVGRYALATIEEAARGGNVPAAALQGALKTIALAAARPALQKRAGEFLSPKPEAE